MKVKIEIKNRFTGSIIFSYEKENNTVKDTVLKALEEKTNLYGANLVRANLDGANLYGANLVRANLDGANLDGANLVRANLVRANLDGANLVRANLDGANLDGANLDGANLDGANLDGANLDGANLVRANLYGANLDGANLPIFCKWGVAMQKGEDGILRIKIGCKEPRTISEWVAWFDGSEEYSTSRVTDEFNRIKGMFFAYKSYIEIVGEENLFPMNPDAGAEGKATAEKFNNKH
jgi:hypothetical protein